MFNWEINVEMTANATPDDVWNIWKDVPNWPKWDKDLEWSRLNGDFAKGTTGRLKPKGWFASDFIISDLTPNQSHVNTTKMPQTKLVFKHELEKISDSQVRIQHNLRVKGLLAPLLFFTMRVKLRKAIPEALENLVAMVSR